MSVTLYHCKNARSLRPLWTLEELGLEYELITLPFPPRVYQKPYLGINPLGTIPYFVEGELKMTESVAICQYLVTRQNADSVAASLAVAPNEPDYAAYLNWLYHSEATLTFPLAVVMRYTYVEPEERRLPQAATDYRAFFLGRLRWLNAALADRDYLCSGRFTIADICVGYALHFASNLGINEAFDSPAIRNYWDRITNRHAYQRAIQPLEANLR